MCLLPGNACPTRVPGAAWVQEICKGSQVSVHLLPGEEHKAARLHELSPASWLHGSTTWLLLRKRLAANGSQAIMQLL
jgi:hypothetical protein